MVERKERYNHRHNIFEIPKIRYEKRAASVLLSNRYYITSLQHFLFQTRVAGLVATNVHVRLTPSARNRKFRQQNTEPLKRLSDIEPLFERMTHSAASTEEFFDFPQLGMSIRFDPEAELVIKGGSYYY